MCNHLIIFIIDAIGASFLACKFPIRIDVLQSFDGDFKTSKQLLEKRKTIQTLFVVVNLKVKTLQQW